MNTSIHTVASLYSQAKQLADCLYDFPYIDPASVPAFIKTDKELMAVIQDGHKTTIGSPGKRRQSTMDPAERILLQNHFKKRIFKLLNNVFRIDKEHGPAMLLFATVASFNTRARHRQTLIKLYEKLLPHVEKIRKSSHAHLLIKEDIAGMGGNHYEKVERHLADFHYALAKLYKASKQTDLAKQSFSRANKLLPQVYGKGPRKIKLF